MNNLSKWLEKKNYNEIPNTINTSKFIDYYDMNDIDIKMNDTYMIDIINNSDIYDEYVEKCEKFMEIYKNPNKDINVLIPINTNAHIVNKIFKDMIDCAIENDLKILDIENEREVPIFNKAMKTSFYNFCKRYM